MQVKDVGNDGQNELVLAIVENIISSAKQV